MFMVSAQELGFKEGEATVYTRTEENPLLYPSAIQKIKAAGQHLISSVEILQKRYEELKRFAAEHGEVGSGKIWKETDFVRECPLNTHFVPTSAGIYATNETIIIQPRSPQLAELSPDTPSYKSGLPLSRLGGENAYVYTKEVLGELTKAELRFPFFLGGGGFGLTEEQVVKNDYVHPIWLGLADGNKELVRNITTHIFKALRDCYNYDEGMGFNFDATGTLVPAIFYRFESDECACVAPYNVINDFDDPFDFIGLASARSKEKGQAMLLEELLGKGTEAGDTGVIVVRKEDISTVAYKLLTGKK